MPRRAEEGGGPVLLQAVPGRGAPADRGAVAATCAASGLAAPTARMFQHLRRLLDARKPHYLPMNAVDMELKGRGESWTRDRVETLVAEGRRERGSLEFKRSLDARGKDNLTKQPWAAMANSGGGVVVYGVEEAHTVATRLRPVRVHGVEERIEQENDRIDPPTNLTVHVLRTDADLGYVVVVVRPAVPGVIHLVDGRAPKRLGTTTTYMGSEEIRRWIQQGERPT